MWGLPHEEREYPIGKVLTVLASRPHGFDDWRLPTRAEVADLKAAMDGYLPPPVTLYSKVHTPGAGTMEKGPWNKETIEEKSAGSGAFFNPSFLPDYALQAMGESANWAYKPAR